MLRFWRNPEFVRHCRAELRRNRALAVLPVVLVIGALIGLGCWASRASELEAVRRWATQFHREDHLAQFQTTYVRDIWRLFYRWLMLVQAGVLSFWSLLACAQSVSGERERKTWDFQRTTRLTPGELLVGKLLGEPVLAYFMVICCFPMALAAAIGGKLRVSDFVSAYAMIMMGALFIGLVGLWLSSLLESRRGFGLLAAIGLFVLFVISYNVRMSNYPGLAAFSPLAGLLPLLQVDTAPNQPIATIFGQKVPWLVASLVLYVTFGAWLVVMLVRNLKRDYEGMRLLTRWQALGCAAFVNFVVYAAFHPRSETFWVQGDMMTRPTAPTPQDLVKLVVVFNTVILFGIGLATLVPYERLKVWSRRRAEGKASLLAEEGLAWPWLALSAVIAYALLVWGLLAWRSVLGFERNVLSASALQLLTVLLFVTGDVIFIQWCRLTRMRAPLLKGVLYLGLYYATAIVLTIVVSLGSQPFAEALSAVLTPVAAFDDRIVSFRAPLSVGLGWALQCVFIGIMIAVITRRVQRPAN